MDEVLAKNDIPAVERALTAAIAQGTLTQNQINNTRGAIQSRSSAISDQRLAQQRAKREQEQAVATSNPPRPGPDNWSCSEAWKIPQRDYRFQKRRHLAYGYEVIFKDVDKDPLGVFGNTKVMWTSAPIRGTFTDEPRLQRTVGRFGKAGKRQTSKTD